MVVSFGVSDPGPVRPTNEDAFLADDTLALFVVADGMGGHAAGQVASRLAIESVENFIRRSHHAEDFSWPCGIDPALSFAGNRLRTAIYLANRRVFRVAEGHDDYTGMGTTVVCALITGAQLSIGHVGDSRLYLLSNDTLVPQTRDDTWAATVLADGKEREPDLVKKHPMRHVLTNVLGAREQPEIHVSERTLAPGETLLLCSDGIHNAIDDETLKALLLQGGDVRSISESIVATALDRGGRDNATAVLVRYLDGSNG
jgi:serine/threonine protein phosphatase PrpC